MRIDTQSVNVMARAPRRVLDMQSGRFVLTPASAPARHFDVIQLTATSVMVRAGPGIRLAGGVKYAISLTVDGGTTSTNLTSYLTLTGITASTHIVLDFDDPLHPTTLTASSTGSATYPTADVTFTRRVLAKITCASSVITAIDQYEADAWLSFWSDPDAVSLNYQATSHKLEIKGWATVGTDAGTGWPTNGAIVGRTAGSPFGDPFFASPNRLIAGVSTWTGIDFGIAGGSPTWTTAPTSIFPHHCVTELDHDDHTQYFKLGLTTDKAGSYARNRKSAEHNYAGNNFYVEGSALVEGTTDITPGTAASGAFQLTGGGSIAKRFQILDTEAGSIAGNTGALRCSGGGTFLKRTAVGVSTYFSILCETNMAASFGDGTRTAEICNGTYALAVSGGINTDGAYRVAGTQVLGAQGLAVADAAGGATVDAEARTAINTLLARMRAHGAIAT